MAEVFAFDATYRIFGSDEFKNDLHFRWLLKQSSYARQEVTELINYYFDGEEDDYIYKNEYCFIGGPSDNFETAYSYGSRAHIEKNDGFMVYVVPKYDVLYYKILPKEFINKPKEFFENILFYDGFFCHTNNRFFNYEQIFSCLYNKYCTTFDDDWYITSEGQEIAPFMYKNLDLWF
jgi:hypothetical protein